MTLKQLQERYNKRLYIYNGFRKPYKVEDIADLTVWHDFKGDKTDELIEELQAYMTDEDEFLMTEQPFATFGVWYEPSREQLEEANELYALPRDEHLNDWQDRILV